MTGKCRVPDRGEAGLAIALLAFENEELSGRRQSGCIIGMIGCISKTVEHHDRVRDRRKNRAKTILAVEMFGDKGNRLFDRSLPCICGEIRLSVAQQSVEHPKG